tara:strand:- start:162 stop:725 length:564 start_codon:yes stop_codon:yes gene_type:complete
MELSRRQFLVGFGGAMAAASAPQLASASINATTRNSGLIAAKTLSFASTHTGEKGTFTFMEHGKYVGEEIARMNQLMRDHRTGDVEQMDVNLFELLANLLDKVDASDKEIQIISAYRSPKTNAKLAANSNGVAKKSYHMRGMAMDIRVPGVDLGHLHKAALDLKAGGVGKYASSNFIHVDTGRVRFW